MSGDARLAALHPWLSISRPGPACAAASGAVDQKPEFAEQHCQADKTSPAPDWLQALEAVACCSMNRSHACLRPDTAPISGAPMMARAEDRACNCGEPSRCSHRGAWGSQWTACPARHTPASSQATASRLVAASIRLHTQAGAPQAESDSPGGSVRLQVACQQNMVPDSAEKHERPGQRRRQRQRA